MTKSIGVSAGAAQHPRPQCASYRTYPPSKRADAASIREAVSLTSRFFCALPAMLAA